MLDYPQMDAHAAAANLIPLSYKWNIDRSFTLIHACDQNCCTVAPYASVDGTVALCGTQWHPFFNNHTYDGGVSEGQAVFNRNGFTYVLTTRNTWDGPAYEIVYRKVQGSLYDSRISSWNTGTSSGEQILMAPNWVSNYLGVPQNGYSGPWDDASYGHPDVFQAWGNYYLVFHAKLPNSTVRHVYFKELTFDANGNISRVYDGYPGHPELDLNYFATPNCEQP
jgi:hypothetical protein